MRRKKALVVSRVQLVVPASKVDHLLSADRSTNPNLRHCHHQLSKCPGQIGTDLVSSLLTNWLLHDLASKAAQQVGSDLKAA